MGAISGGVRKILLWTGYLLGLAGISFGAHIANDLHHWGVECVVIGIGLILGVLVELGLGQMFKEIFR